MRLRAVCQVSSEAAIDSSITVEREERSYTFFPGDRGTIERVEIVAPISRPNLFRSEIVPEIEGQAGWRMTLRYDSELLESLIRDFQDLEGQMALLLGLTRIAWNEMKWELIFDSSEEKEATQIFGYQEQRKYREVYTRVDQAGLRQLVSTIGQYPSLLAPLAFFREGNSDYASSRFINAFFNYYFVLEGLFGKEKTKNSAIERAFGESQALVKALTDMLPEIERRSPAAWSRMQSECAALKQTLNAQGAIRLLVRTRGRLHHFSNNPNRPEGTPLTHNSFEHMTELARGAAIFGLMYRVVELNNEKKG